MQDSGFNVLMDKDDRAYSALQITTEPKNDSRLGPDLICDPPPSCGDQRLVWTILRALGKRREFSSNTDCSWDHVDAWVKAERIQRIFIMRSHSLTHKALDKLHERAIRHNAEIWLVDPTGVKADEWSGRWDVRPWNLESFERHQKRVRDRRDKLEFEEQSISKAEPDESLADLPREVREYSAFAFVPACVRHLGEGDRERFLADFELSLKFFEKETAMVRDYRLAPHANELMLRRFQFLMTTSTSGRDRLIRLRAAQVWAFRNGWHLESPSLETLGRLGYEPAELDLVSQFADPELASIATLALLTGLHPTDLVLLQSFDVGGLFEFKISFAQIPVQIPMKSQPALRAHRILTEKSPPLVDEEVETYLFHEVVGKPSKFWYRLRTKTPWKAPDQILRLAHEVQTISGLPVFHSSWSHQVGVRLARL